MSRGGEGEGPSVADRLADEIADAIMVGEYPLGTWLRQGHLAERFGVSRQPVREALRRLKVVGMIEARPRRGLRVKGLEDLAWPSLVTATATVSRCASRAA